MRVALIDADPMIYVLAWKYREAGIEAKDEVCDATEAFLKYILDITQSSSYIASFSCSTEDNFRTKVYKYAPYKGGRGDKKEWYVMWEPVIKEFLCTRHNFLRPRLIEADDVLSLWSEKYSAFNDYIICSPDKDLDQIAGWHFRYSEKDAKPYMVHKREAIRSLYLQMLTGDGTDNIAGVPGLGPVKAAKILDDSDPMEALVNVATQYIKYFGQYYGPVIMAETKVALSLLTCFRVNELETANNKDVYDESVHVLNNVPNIFTPTRKPLSLFEQMILQ